jgi:hypothetical protein
MPVVCVLMCGRNVQVASAWSAVLGYMPIEIAELLHTLNAIDISSAKVMKNIDYDR